MSLAECSRRSSSFCFWVVLVVAVCSVPTGVRASSCARADTKQECDATLDYSPPPQCLFDGGVCHVDECVVRGPTRKDCEVSATQQAGGCVWIPYAGFMAVGGFEGRQWCISDRLIFTDFVKRETYEEYARERRSPPTASPDGVAAVSSAHCENRGVPPEGVMLMFLTIISLVVLAALLKVIRGRSHLPLWLARQHGTTLEVADDNEGVEMRPKESDDRHDSYDGDDLHNEPADGVHGDPSSQGKVAA